jgi:hypothetical protein
MDKKIVTLILVIFVSFCFLGIVVADNATHDDNNTDNHDKTIDKDDDNVNDNTKGHEKVDKDDDNINENATDKKKTTDKDKTDDKSKTNYILAKGNENDITFSDG